MPGKKEKIFSVFIFIVLLVLVVYLAVVSNNKGIKHKITMIEVNGNSLLSTKDYLKYTKLDDLNSQKDLMLPVIKSRFEKHPYVDYADVEYLGEGKAVVLLTEKKIKAVLLGGKDPYLITDNYEILPLFMNTKFEEIPVISNCPGIEKLKLLTVHKANDLIEAFKIIDAVKLIDLNLSKRLSEIDLKNGGDIILTFSGLKSPVIFGRGEEAEKIAYLDAIWNGKEIDSKLINESKYIDLRFNHVVYFGLSER